MNGLEVMASAFSSGTGAEDRAERRTRQRRGGGVPGKTDWSVDMVWLLHHEFRATMAALTSPLWDQEN